MILSLRSCNSSEKTIPRERAAAVETAAYRSELFNLNLGLGRFDVQPPLTSAPVNARDVSASQICSESHVTAKELRNSHRRPSDDSATFAFDPSTVSTFSIWAMRSMWGNVIKLGSRPHPSLVMVIKCRIMGNLLGRAALEVERRCASSRRP